MLAFVHHSLSAFITASPQDSRVCVPTHIQVCVCVGLVASERGKKECVRRTVESNHTHAYGHVMQWYSSQGRCNGGAVFVLR